MVMVVGAGPNGSVDPVTAAAAAPTEVVPGKSEIATRSLLLRDLFVVDDDDDGCFFLEVGFPVLRFLVCGEAARS